MNRPLAERIPASVAWLVAYGLVWSVFTAISVYVLTAEASPSHVEHLVVAVGFVILTAGSRALIGPHAARAAAYAFVPIGLFFFGSSREVQNELIFGVGQWCGTGRYSAAMFWGVLALPMGALTVALFLLFRRTAVRASATIPSRAFVVQALGVGVLGLALVGTVTAAARPTPKEFRSAIAPVETLRVWPPETHAVTNESGRDLLVACRSGSDMLPIRSGGACRLHLGQPGDASGSRVGASHIISGDEQVVISRHPTEELWLFEVRNEGDAAQPFAVEFDGQVRDTLRVEHIQGRFGPSWFVVGFAWISALMLCGFAQRWSRGRARIGKALEGREGTLDAEGHVLVDGIQHLLEPSLREAAAPGPVVILQTAQSEGYREVNLVTRLLAGSKQDLVEGYADEHREWRPVAIITGILFALPLVASAMLGLL